jgi:hypothetical protein
VQTIVHIKDGLWSNLAVIAFSLTFAAAAVWGDHCSHGEVSIFVWIFASIFVVFCWVPISAIRRPKSRLLAIDGSHLLWRIYDGKTKEAILERRLALSSIRALKWIVPTPADSRRGQDYSNARLVFITAERGSHTLPDEFFPAAHRRKIEATLKQRIPNVNLVEELESPD